MDALHIHLLLNHVPVVGSFGALLLLAWGLYKRSTDVVLAALTGVVLVGLTAIPVFLTGRAIEERVGHLPEIAHTLIEKHEDAAVAAMVGLLATAAIAVAALVGWIANRKLSRFASTAALIIGAAALVLAVRTATLGGQIRHIELEEARITSTPPAAPVATTWSP